MSGNSITTDCADAQGVGVPVLGPISDRACVRSDSETGQVNVVKLVVAALAGWMNQQQQDVIE